MAISKDYAQTFADIDRLSGSKRERALRLADKAQFQNKELTKLQRILGKKGWTEEYQNGANQCGLKQSSEAQVYIQLSRNFLSTMKQLEDMMSGISIPTDESKLSKFMVEDE